MIIKFDKTGTVSGFRNILQDVSDDARTRGILILAAYNPCFTREAVDDLLQAVPQPISGGCFRLSFFTGKCIDRGLSLPDLPEKQMFMSCPA